MEILSSVPDILVGFLIGIAIGMIGSRLAVRLPDTVLKAIVIVMVAGSGTSLLFGIGH